MQYYTEKLFCWQKIVAFFLTCLTSSIKRIHPPCSCVGIDEHHYLERTDIFFGVLVHTARN